MNIYVYILIYTYISGWGGGLRIICLSAGELPAQSRARWVRWDGAAVTFAAGCSRGSCLLFREPRGRSLGLS